jgi:hypothetical protein
MHGSSGRAGHFWSEALVVQAAGVTSDGFLVGLLGVLLFSVSNRLENRRNQTAN